MVRCKAHNLETENACAGSIPAPATKISFVVEESYFNNLHETLLLSSLVTMKLFALLV